jgi:hypothetical protein
MPYSHDSLLFPGHAAGKPVSDSCGQRNFYGLPLPAAQLLEEDRKALDVDRADHLHHLPCERSIAVREKRPGFDSPRVSCLRCGGRTSTSRARC